MHTGALAHRVAKVTLAEVPEVMMIVPDESLPDAWFFVQPVPSFHK
jgi:hypothetical protein